MQTLGDGNCAFNAFAQGLYSLFSSGQLPFDKLPPDFVDQAVKTEYWADCESLKAWFVAGFHTADEQHILQTKLALILRTMSINYLREHHKHTALDESFKEAVVSFRKYGATQNNPDNLFRLIPKIRQQFEQNQFPEVWWVEQGRDVYFAHMEQSACSAADISRWGSQVELSALADLFQVTIQFERNGDCYKLGAPRGVVADSDDDIPDDLDLQLLINRNILSEYCGCYSFNDRLGVTLDMLCAAVPHHEELLAMLNAYKTRALRIDEWVSNIAPNEKEAVKTMLEIHGVVTSEYVINDGNHKQPGPPNVARIKQQITKLSDEVQQYLRAHYREASPTFAIRLHAGHWEISNSHMPSSSQPGIRVKPSTTKRVAQLHAASGVKRALHGTIYQLMILMRVFKTATDQELKFKLATEMDAAEKFDDMVIGVEGVDGQLTYHYLQAKHKQSDTTSVKNTDLANTSDGDFSMVKYFRSFRNIRKNKAFSGAKKGDFVLYTNAKMDLKSATSEQLPYVLFLQKSDRRSPIVSLCGGAFGQLFHFKKNQEAGLKNIRERLKKVNVLHEQAEKMAEIVVGKKKFGFKTDHFKKSHVALVRDVLDLDEKRFRESFIKGTTQNAALNELLRLFKQYWCDLQKTKDGDVEKLWQAFVKQPVIVGASDSFGDKLEVVKEPKLNDVDQTVKALLACLKDGKFHINRRTKGFNHNKMSQLAGYVIVNPSSDSEKDCYVFSRAFLNNEKMPSGIEPFRKAFFAAMKKSHPTVSLSDCEIRILKFKTCDDGSLVANDDLWESIPNDVVSDQELDAFFEALLIATEQPNELEMYEAIKDELGDNFNLCDTQFLASSFEHNMLKWFKEKQGVFLTKKDGEEMFSEARQQLARLVLLGPALEYDYMVRNAHVTFSQFFNIQGLLQSQKQVCCVRAQYNTWLTMLRIYPALKRLDDYRKDDSFIVLKLSTAINLSKRVVEAFKISDLLIVECASKPKSKDFLLLVEALKPIIKNNNEAGVHKKVWFIVPQQFDMAMLEEQFTLEVLNDNAQFDCFTAQSQKALLEKRVDLGGSTVLANELLTQKMLNNDSSLLKEMLITEQLVFSVPTYSMRKFDRECYIEREFIQRRHVNESVFEKCVDQIVVVTKQKSFGSVELETYNSWKKSFDEQIIKNKQEKKKIKPMEPVRLRCCSMKKAKETAHVLRKLISEEKSTKSESGMSFKSETIHILEASGKMLEWQFSDRAIDGVRDFFIDHETVVGESELKLVQQSVIAAEPGMGKTTVLTHMVSENESDSVFPIIMKMDLSQHKKELDQWSLAGIEDVINLLQSAFNWNNFTRQYISHSLHHGTYSESASIHFYFDGFDEISTSQQSTVQTMVRILDRSTARVAVATRRHMTQLLENTFCAPAYALKQIDSTKQQIYLTKYWCGQFVEMDKKRASVFAKSLVEKFGKDIISETNNFMGIPLQLRLIAEAFEDQVVSFCESKDIAFDERLKYDPVKAYKLIIAKKYKIYFDDKRNMPDRVLTNELDVIQRDLHAAHYQVAFDIIFPAITRLQVMKATKFTSQHISSVGLIEILDNEPQFIHRTFGEFLVAEAITSWLAAVDDETSSEYQELVEFILLNVFKDRCRVVLRFINDIVNTSPDARMQHRWTAIAKSQLEVVDQKRESLVQTCRMVSDRRVEFEDFGLDFEEKSEEQKEGLSLQDDFQKELGKLQPYVKDGGNRYRPTANAVDQFGEFVLRHLSKLSLSDIGITLDNFYSVLSNYRNGAIVKTAVYEYIPKISDEYLQKAFFPSVNKNYDFKKLERFFGISSTVFSHSSLLDESVTQETMCSAQDQLKVYSKVKEKLEHHESTWFDNVDKAALVAIYMSFTQLERTLTKKQTNILLEKYKEFSDNSFFHRAILLQDKDDVSTINQLRRKFFQQGNLELLQSLRAAFPEVSYDVTKEDMKHCLEIGKFSMAKIVYLLHSTVLLSVNQVEAFLRLGIEFQEQNEVDYWRLLTKVSEEYVEVVKDLAIKKDHLQWLQQLKEYFPELVLTEQDFKLIYHDGRHLYWFERLGAELLLRFGQLSGHVVDCYRKNFRVRGNTDTMLGYYVDNVESNLIMPYLTRELFAQDHFSNQCHFVDLCQVFLGRKKFSERTLHFDSATQFFGVLIQIAQAFSCYPDMIDGVLNKLMAFSQYFGLSARVYNNKFILSDPKSDFSLMYEFSHKMIQVLQRNKQNGQYVVDTSKRLSASESTLHDQASHRMDLLALMRERRRLLYHHDTVAKMLEDKKGVEYLAALRDDSLHDAVCIKNDRDQETLVFDKQHTGGRYRFFSQLSVDIQNDELDKDRFVVSKVRY